MSGSDLERFFHDLDIDDSIVNKESRLKYVTRAVNAIDATQAATGEAVSAEMAAFISSLADEERWGLTPPYEDGVKELNAVLAKHSLRWDADSRRLVNDAGVYVSSSKPNVATERVLLFSPSVFRVPETDPDPHRVAVMMPFDDRFTPVYRKILKACKDNGLTCKRADTIWKDSKVMEDIFELIATSAIIVSDLTGRNANVFYETGIAHTLGKHVIPITQSKDDVPFDLQQHRYLSYLGNSQGIDKMIPKLVKRLRYLAYGENYEDDA
jgi:hypothetical protein